MWKENLSESISREAEISTTIDSTKKWLSWLEEWIFKKFFSNILNRFKNLFWSKKDQTETQTPDTEGDERTENIEWPIWWNTVSNEMFQQLLSMEWKQNFKAKIHWKNFWETFVTGPYGMVYKHIDKNWNLLKYPTTFQDWEQVSPSWAEQNARAYYNKRAKKRKEILDYAWCKYNQNMLDALVSASWWTVKSFNYLKDYITTHWNNKTAIQNFRTKFATTAAWNGKVMPWLVRRRKFEVNWFKWIKKPFSSYPVR